MSCTPEKSFSQVFSEENVGIIYILRHPHTHAMLSQELPPQVLFFTMFEKVTALNATNKLKFLLKFP